MTREFRVVPVFIAQEDVETLQTNYPGIAIDRLLEKMVERETKIKIIKRCARCDKEMQLLVPKTAHPVRFEWFENVEGARCSKCNPQSRWTRVEDTE